MREYHEIRQTVDGDTEAAGALLGVARTQLGILKNALTLGGLPSGKRTVQLPDGTVIQVSSAYGQDSVRISVPPPAPGRPAPQPEAQDWPEPVRGVTPSINLGALCDAGSYQVWSTIVANKVMRSGYGLDGAASLPQLVPCNGGLNYAVTLDPARFKDPIDQYNGVTLTLELYDLNTTALSVVGRQGSATYHTFDGRPYLLGENPPVYATTARLLTLNNAHGAPVPALRILKWEQHGGTLTLLPFTLDGARYPSALYSAIPMGEQLGEGYYEATGLFEYALVEPEVIIGGYPEYEVLAFQKYVIPYLPTHYTAAGTLTVIDLNGSAQGVPLTVSVAYQRSGSWIITYLPGPGVGFNFTTAFVKGAMLLEGTGSRTVLVGYGSGPFP